MKEIINKIDYKEFNLAMLRVIEFLNVLGPEHKKKSTKDRIALYDFYLKFPELLQKKNQRKDFDTKYSYFHWVPDYNFYSAIFSNLEAKGLIIKDKSDNYSITILGMNAIKEMDLIYLERVKECSDFIISNICKLSNKAIMEDINSLIYSERGM